MVGRPTVALQSFGAVWQCSCGSCLWRTTTADQFVYVFSSFSRFIPRSPPRCQLGTQHTKGVGEGKGKEKEKWSAWEPGLVAVVVVVVWFWCCWRGSPARWAGAMWKMWMPPKASTQSVASSGLVMDPHLKLSQSGLIPWRIIYSSLFCVLLVSVSVGDRWASSWLCWMRLEQLSEVTTSRVNPLWLEGHSMCRIEMGFCCYFFNVWILFIFDFF